MLRKIDDEMAWKLSTVLFKSPILMMMMIFVEEERRWDSGINFSDIKAERFK